MSRDYNDYYVGQAPLSVRTHYNEKESYLSGVLHTRIGWHWHFSVELPYRYNGNPVLNGYVVQGPFLTEEEALADAQNHMSGRYTLPTHNVVVTPREVV